ncbi:hypothetical protein BH11VER1_BH11VER1_20960 [soil metagenome]
MLYLLPIFWLFITGVVTWLAISGITRGDFSSNGHTIRRADTPVRFWICASYHLAVGSFLLWITVIATMKVYR